MNTFVCVIYIFALRLASHSSLGDQNNCCADYENGTNDVEHCCADATGGRKLCASHVNYEYRICCKVRVGIGNLCVCLCVNNIAVCIDILCNSSSRNKVWIGCITRAFLCSDLLLYRPTPGASALCQGSVFRGSDFVFA